MMRHNCARREREDQGDTPVISPGFSRKQAIDEALVNMIITDCQPLSRVEDEGFRALLQVLEPSYVLPSRKAIKTIISQRYEEKKEPVEKKAAE